MLNETICKCLLASKLSYCVVRRFLFETHYDVLQVKKDCSPKDIREAYIRLTKQYHPDKTAAATSQKKFFKIVEAYKVLSKPDKRRNYDIGLMFLQLLKKKKGFCGDYSNGAPNVYSAPYNPSKDKLQPTCEINIKLIRKKRMSLAEIQLEAINFSYKMRLQRLQERVNNMNIFKAGRRVNTK